VFRHFAVTTEWLESLETWSQCGGPAKCLNFQELWGLSTSETPSVIKMFSSVSMIASAPTPCGPRWHVSNLAQDYMVYWAKMSGKGADIGRLQRWLLEDPDRAGRICKPFGETSHVLLLRSPATAAEATRLTAFAADVNVDTALSTAVDHVLQQPASALDARRAGYAISLAAAAADLRMHKKALALLRLAGVAYEAVLPVEKSALIGCQIAFAAAVELMAVGKAEDAMRELEGVLKKAQVPPRSSSFNRIQ
jgi:hypothetical protein